MSTSRWAARLSVAARASAALGLLLVGTSAWLNAPGATAAAGDVPAASAELGGFDLSATASPVELVIDSPSLPLHPAGQLAIPYAIATLESGPTAYALSSLAWPGPLVADAGPVLSQFDPRAGQVPIPADPVVSRAEFPSGPTDARQEASPGSVMDASAAADAARSRGTLAEFGSPGVLEVGSMDAQSVSTSPTGLARAEALSVAGDITVAGAVHIDSVVSRLVSSSNGDKAQASGGTTVSGVTVAGLAATVDEQGLRLTDPRAAQPLVVPLGQVRTVGDAVNALIDQAGLRIETIAPQLTATGGSADAITNGLRVQIDAGTAEPVVGPASDVLVTAIANLGSAGFPSDLTGPLGILASVATAPYTIDAYLGVASALAHASPGFVVPDLGGGPDLGLPADAFVPTATDVPSIAPPAVDGVPLALGSPAANPSARPTSVVEPLLRRIASGRGLPAGLGLGLLALAPVCWLGSRRLTDAVLAPVEAACALEGDR